MLPITLGLLSLLVLQLMMVRGHWSGRRLLLLFGGGLLVAVVCIHLWLRPPRFLPDASTSGLSKQLALDIRDGLSDPATSEFFLVEGGSYSARGLDGQELQKRLSIRLKRPVKVLVVSAPGANQYERWSIVRNGLALLDKETRSRFEAARITVLMEIHANYDRRPLVQLTRNRHTDRAYAYLQPDVAWAAAQVDHGRMEPEDRRRLWKDVFAHSAINAFNIGAALRAVPVGRVVPSRGFVPMTASAPGFRFRGMKAALQAFEEKTGRVRGGLPERNIAARRERIAALLGSDSPRFIYYSVASVRPQDLIYGHAFCRKFQQFTCIDHAQSGLLKRLNAKRFWYDNGHMQKQGAKIYTRWLARRLAQELKSSPPEVAE